MASLSELQQRFVDALYASEGAAAGFAVAGATASSGRIGIERMDVYRRAIFANYRKALAATYPSVQRLIGASVFAEAVDAYVREHPSKSGDLNDYGDAFGTFLAAYPPGAHLAYLPDIARLEWAIDEAARAAEVTVAPDAVLASLAALPADRVSAVTLRLAPSCRLLASEFPIFAIWQASQPGYDGDDRAEQKPGSETPFAVAQQFVSDPTFSGDRLLVRRDAAGIGVERLAAGEHAWLVALADGVPLGASVDAACQADSAFDLGHVLHAHIGAATIVSVLADG